MTDQEKFYQREIKQMYKKMSELKSAANELIHLHMCEQEGIVSGQPTSKQWLEAVDKLSELLNPKS